MPGNVPIMRVSVDLYSQTLPASTILEVVSIVTRWHTCVWWGAKTYCNCIVNQEGRSYHPKLDMTEEANREAPELDWSFSMGILPTRGQYDILCTTMSMRMGRFGAAPKLGHLKGMIRVCGYLKKHPADYAAIVRFRTESPIDEDHAIRT
jgi:hypothetical protein